MKGQSKYTAIKQFSLGAMLDVYGSIVEATGFFKPAIFDLTAGDGEADRFSYSIPSPFTLYCLSRRLNVPLTMFEREQEEYERLKRKTNHWIDTYVWNEDFMAGLEREIAAVETRYETRGQFLYLDPNGWIERDDDLVVLLNEHRRADLLCNVGASSIKRNNGCGRLYLFAEHIRRSTKLIRMPIGKQQWCMFYFSNGPMGGWKNMGWFELYSDEGQRILERAAWKTPRAITEPIANISEQPNSAQRSILPAVARGGDASVAIQLELLNPTT